VTHAEGDVGLLEHEAELALIRKLLLLPEIVETAVRDLAPHHLPHYALDVAQVFSKFYEKCPVLRDDVPLPLRQARLRLVLASKQVLSNTLTLIGVAAPERMERVEQD
jgi:arginyl-tRNA synthetase